jgi:hypothetical protein
VSVFDYRKLKIRTNKMPFAGYKNFAACVRANSDKNNPSAYCGEIMHQVEARGEAFHVKEDTKIGAYGETDYDKQQVRINPRYGDVVNTIIHENLHVKYPKMPHDDVYKMASEVEGKMSIREMRDMLSDTVREIEQGAVAPTVHTVGKKVINSKIT